MQRMISLIALFFCVLPSMTFGSITGNAGCFLRSGDQIVLVKDIWSKKYGLPGGTASGQELAAQTAERETLEETGIHVSAKALLTTTTHSFHIYDCEPEGNQIEVSKDGRISVPTDAFNEIEEIRWIDPHRIPLNQWRFPEQKNHLIDLLSPAHSGLQSGGYARSTHFQPVLRSDPHVHAIIDLELRWIRAFQSLQNSFLDHFFAFFSFLGGEEFALLFITLIWFGINKRLGIELGFVFSISLLIHGIFKQSFGIPRPTYFMPELQRQSADGFGFPSGHTLTITLVWSWIAFNFRFPGKWAIAVFLAFMGGLARIYWGVHFFHDVLGGWMLALGLLAFYILFLRHKNLSLIPLKSWYIATAVIGPISLLVRPHPETISIICFLVGLIVALRPFHSFKVSTQEDFSSNHFELPIVFAGILLIYLGGSYFSSSGAFLPCLLVRILKYLLLGMWMGTLSLYSLDQSRQFTAQLISSVKINNKITP